MAKKHRKLFPMLSSEPNNTLDCSTGVCDQSCPYNCYQEPDYYALAPQLPPWSFQQPTTAPSPSPSPMIPAIYQQSQKTPFSLDAVTIISVTGAVFVILLTGFFIVAKFVTERVNRVNHEGYQSDQSHDTEEFQDREQVDHPIWFIRTTGLQQSIINSITICRYKRGDGLIERTDCPVCLNEFEEDESLRLLPKCNHAFHISCIDTWLRSHTNCPLCRAGVAISMTPRCSGPVDVNPGGSESHVESDGDGDDEDHDQIENRAELGREMDQSDSKERLSSSYRDSHNSDVRNEISRATNEIHQNSEQTHGDGSENRNETEKNEETRVFGESTDQHGDNSVDSVSATDNVDYTRKSCDDQSENSKDHKIQSGSRSKSMDAGESSGETTEERGKSQSGISSNSSKANESSSMPRLNRNKSWVFPL